MVKGQSKLRAIEAGLQVETSPDRKQVPLVQCKHCGAEQEQIHVKCRVCSVLLDTHTKGTVSLHEHQRARLDSSKLTKLLFSVETSDATRKFFADRTKENKNRSRRQSVERRNSSSAMKVAKSMAQEVSYARRKSIS